VTDGEMRQLQDLAGQACYLARLRDRQRFSETEFIDRLNELRQKHGLWPIHPTAPGRRPKVELGTGRIRSS
jgi:hypothetical protein